MFFFIKKTHSFPLLLLVCTEFIVLHCEITWYSVYLSIIWRFCEKSEEKGSIMRKKYKRNHVYKLIWKLKLLQNSHNNDNHISSMETFSSQIISVWPFPRASPSSPWCLSDEWNQVVGRAVFRSHVCQPSTYNFHVIWREWIHFSLSLSIPVPGHRNGVSVSLESDEEEGVSGSDISPLDHVRSVDGLLEFGDRGLQSQAQFATRHLRQIHCLFIFPSLLKIVVLVRWIWFSKMPSYLRFS